MIYMLDTDICSYIMRDRAAWVLQNLNDKSSAGHVVCMSVITYQELRFGAERVSSKKYHERIDAICERIDYVTNNLKHFTRVPGLAVENWFEA